MDKKTELVLARNCFASIVKPDSVGAISMNGTWRSSSRQSELMVSVSSVIR